MMHHHSYTVDSLSKSQDLTSAILASSTPSQISTTCTSITSFLHSLTPDQSRHFFSFTFPTLICKLYGFDHSTSPQPLTGPHQSSNGSSGWIDTVIQTNDSDLASRVFTLLSPNSVLFHAISAVDRQSLVKYVFPIERLPEWARLAISSNKDSIPLLNNLSPLFNGKIKDDFNSIKTSSGGGSLYYQIQLNVFEYFMFWFAYYPISKANSENSNNVLNVKRTKVFNLENWAPSVPGFSHSRRGNEHKLECNLYIRLLYAYLRAFVPIFDLGLHQPCRSSLLHYGYGNDGSVFSRAEFFVDTLVHYWLVDNDFSPMPVSVCESVRLLLFPLRSVLGETLPPTPNLGEAVKLFVKYLNLSAFMIKEGELEFGCAETPKWGMAGLSSGSGSGSFDVKLRELAVSMRVVGSWNSWIQRPVYRFILRTFLFCPLETSIKNASLVFSVWVSYMEPWNVGLDDFVELDAIMDGPGKGMKKEGDAKSKECGYAACWQGYVLSNYLYYSSLVMHFIGFAHKFLHTDPEVIVEMVLKVVKILTSTKELTNLIKNMDTVFHSRQVGLGKSALNSLYKYIPLIRELLQDWEDGLCESDADGSFLHENWNKDLRLFGDEEDGGQRLLQLFILRAEAELQANSGDKLAENLQRLDSLKSRVSCLFGGYMVKPISFALETKLHEPSRDEIFKPRRVSNKAWADVKYKGDWMKRPISDDEVAWLAKLLIWLSSWLNERFGLNQAECSDVGPKWSYLEISSDADNVCESTETVKMVLCAIGSWFLMLGAATVRFMRRHGLRVNLRMLASKKIVMILCVVTLFSILKKAFGQFHRA